MSGSRIGRWSTKQSLIIISIVHTATLMLQSMPSLPVLRATYSQCTKTTCTAIVIKALVRSYASSLASKRVPPKPGLSPNLISSTCCRQRDHIHGSHFSC